MSLKKILGFSLLSSCLITAGLGSIPITYAQEIGRWVGETSEGFPFVFTITPERTIERIQFGYIRTCESGREETLPDVTFTGRIPIINQRFVFGAPVRDGSGGNLTACHNLIFSGEFTSPTEARGTFESLELRFRVMEKAVGAQLCRTNDVTWEATFQPAGDADAGNNISTISPAGAQEIGRWVGETSQGFPFVFTITLERTIERIQVGFTLTCESGMEETHPNVTFGFGAVPIVDQRFVYGRPVSEDRSDCSNMSTAGEFTSPTEARGTFEYLDLRFRVVEQTVSAQLCRTKDVTWEASFQPEDGGKAAVDK